MSNQTNVHGCPTAWFAMLERARLANDYELEQRAYAELERLGVVVAFRGHRAHEIPNTSKEKVSNKT